jgi:hypothetical protein
MEDEKLVAFLIAGRLMGLLRAGQLNYRVAWIAQDRAATLGFRLFYDQEPVNFLLRRGGVVIPEEATDGRIVLPDRREVVVQYLIDAFELSRELADLAVAQAHEWRPTEFIAPT